MSQRCREGEQALMVPVHFKDQIQPGTIEHAVGHAILVWGNVSGVLICGGSVSVGLLPDIPADRIDLVSSSGLVSGGFARGSSVPVPWPSHPTYAAARQ